MSTRRKVRPVDEDWTERLDRTGKGRVVGSTPNAHIILGHDEAVVGLFSWNELTAEVEVTRPPPWDRPGRYPRPVDDVDTVKAGTWLSEHYKARFTTKHVAEAVLAVADDHRRDPIRDYLRGLTWDGVDRCDHWLSDFLEVPRSDYVAAVGRRWLISAVARALRPGCKADCVLVLEGKQGARKSSALAVLGGEWFADDPLKMDSMEGARAIQGKWIWELPELATARKSDNETIKAFLAKSKDSFRLPFGRHYLTRPRRCVFAASVNDGEYLNDPTGGRRFWPVKCGAVDLEGLAAVRDQLWAEAVVRYHRHEAWWLDTPELEQAAAEQVGARFAADVWESVLGDKLQHETETTTLDALQWLGVELHRVDRSMQIRVGVALRRLGFEPAERPRDSGPRRRVYRRPSAGRVVRLNFAQRAVDAGQLEMEIAG
jgi:putative DNA primase/helicase